MARAKYRLEPLAQARQANVEKSMRVLAEATKARQAAELVRVRIEQEAERARLELTRIRGEERSLQKSVRADDLVTYDTWEIRAENERIDRERRFEVAKGSESKEALREAAARAVVEKRQAEVLVLERDRARFEIREAKQAEVRQESEANDAWRKRSE
ncbi:MAG: hypothetical protein ABI461_00790 [Polyangiaceae bacterium]